MIGILSYGVGNVASVVSRFYDLGFPNQIINDSSQIENCSALILPGVGSFDKAMAMFTNSGLAEATIAAVSSGIPILGICVGHQMLFETGNEGGEITKGLGLLQGKVTIMKPKNFILPHMGWNKFSDIKPHKLLEDIDLKDEMYYLHSFHAIECDNDVIAETWYGGKINSIVVNGNIIGIQGHPEKSHSTGMKIFKNFGVYYGT